MKSDSYLQTFHIRNDLPHTPADFCSIFIYDWERPEVTHTEPEDPLYLHALLQTCRNPKILILSSWLQSCKSVYIYISSIHTSNLTSTSSHLITVDHITSIQHPLCNVNPAHSEQLKAALQEHRFACSRIFISITAKPLSRKLLNTSLFLKGSWKGEWGKTFAGF